MIVRILVCLTSIAAGISLAHAQDIPRTSDGRPDFQGVWESRWLTPLERMDGTTEPTVSGDAAIAYAAARSAALQNEGVPLHPDDDFDFSGLLPAGDGTFRTSLIVEPADGKRPQSQLAKDLAPIGREIRKSAANPEGLSNDERCMSATGRAPLAISPGSMYRQIVQTPSHVMIYTEDQMVTRVIGIDAAPRPAGLVSLAGDSIATWEGDTLVIVTTQIRPQLPVPGAPAFDQQRRVTERFNLITPDQISYQFALEDSAMLTAPMRVQYTFMRTNHAMFESACHEGNYSILHMMLGARLTENAKPAP